MELDNTDVKLLRALSEKGRESLRKIAKELGVSTVTVMNRLKKLETEKVLRGFTARIDPKKTGYEITAIISLKIARKSIRSVQEKISKYSNVCGIYDVTGDFDSVIVARFKTIEEMDNFIKIFLAVEGMERTYTSIALNVIKEDFRVNL